MKQIARIFMAAAILAAHPALAHEYRIADIGIGHPWSRATLPAAKVGGGYLKLTNEGESADHLLGGSSPIAGRVEIHSMEVDDKGVMTMRPVTDGLEIPAGKTVELAPGGYHLMLMDLKHPLTEGERVPLTLKFEHAGSIDVELAVESARGSTHDSNGHDSHSDHGAAHSSH